MAHSPKPIEVMKNSADINVMNYGATGNGTTDDTQAINNALAAASSSHVGCYFPNGTYLCNTIDQYGEILLFSVSGNNESIYGTGTITTSVVAAKLLNVNNFISTKHFNINGLTFTSTHPVTSVATNGVFMTGTGAQLMDSATVSYCTFSGFCVDLEGQGIDQWLIQRNQFYAPRGHDDGTTTTIPNANIILPVNSNGFCDDVTIDGNIGNGFTGTSLSSTTTTLPMDGLVYGTAWKTTITNNRTSNYGQEHIMLTPWPTSGFNGSAPYPAFLNINHIENNNISCFLPAGAMDSVGRKHKYNYGIRVDASNTYVDNNYVFNYTSGILSRPIDYSGYTADSIMIFANRMTEALDTANYSVTGGIVINGSITYGYINSNQIQRVSQSPIQISNNTTITTLNNYLFPTTCNCFF